MLDGASRDNLRKRFREWRTTAVEVENLKRPREGVNVKLLGGRYLVFVYVDEEALVSVLAGEGDWLDPGWV